MPYSRSHIVYMLASILLAVGSGVGSAEPHKQVGVWFFGLCAAVFRVLPWTEGFPALLQRIQQLPDFNNEAVVLAMGSAANDRFVVWRLQPTAK